MSVNKENHKTVEISVFVSQLVVPVEHPQDAECWEINWNGMCNHEQTMAGYE